MEAIWISPFFKSPMADFGYDIADYRAVDPLFGTLEDFDRLLRKAHGLGLKIVIDQVLSHTSSEHAWFAESRQDRSNPRADWYGGRPRPDGVRPTTGCVLAASPGSGSRGAPVLPAIFTARNLT